VVGRAARRHTPDRGDVVWLDFDPGTGHEQAGRRPALVLTPQAYNDKVGLAVFCPITSRVKGYPFEVQLPSRFKVRGVVLVDQVRSLDWRARKAALAGRVPEAVLAEVTAKLRALLLA